MYIYINHKAEYFPQTLNLPPARRTALAVAHEDQLFDASDRSRCELYHLGVSFTTDITH